MDEKEDINVVGPTGGGRGTRLLLKTSPSPSGRLVSMMTMSWRGLEEDGRERNVRVIHTLARVGRTVMEEGVEGAFWKKMDWTRS